MQRRALLSLLALGFAAPAAAQEARARRVVYHIADVDKVAFALANMRNHRAGGPRPLALAADADIEGLKREFAAHRAAGDVFYACANTLAHHHWTLDDLLPGFALAEQGGVVKLADLQAQGWVYLRP
jgi:intracellular sulfur oxidation DsrE/DsrF family protein